RPSASQSFTPPGRARRIGVVGLCVGAGGSMVATAVAQGCDAFITGEMRHHDVLDAIARGCTVILAGHTNTERGYLKVLQRRLGEALPDLECTVSRKDVDPLRSA
ncbi:MAG: Nif3-like dinuclear metal center hexameric protein, partial [Phycisphaerales bacterium]|nr:Nif3-like dinuclear metal center hexameric protein [Phycisphaerales bacterium]